MRLYFEVRKWSAVVCVILLVLILGIVLWEMLVNGQRGEPTSSVTAVTVVFWMALSYWCFQTMRHKDETIWQVSLMALICWAIAFLPFVLRGLAWRSPESVVAYVWVLLTPVVVALDLVAWFTQRLLTSWRRPIKR